MYHLENWIFETLELGGKIFNGLIMLMVLLVLSPIIVPVFLMGCVVRLIRFCAGLFIVVEE